MAANPVQLSGLARRLVEDNLLEEEAAIEATEEARKTRVPFVTLLVQNELVKAGVPLVQSFEIVADGMDNPMMKDLILNIKDEVSAGNSFAHSIRTQPDYFDDLFCNLIDAGEQSGSLETMLDRLATYKEKPEQLKTKIKAAMNYPLAVLAVAGVVTGILLIKVVPQFEEIFAGFGAELPEFTQMVVNKSNFMQEWWFATVAAMAAAYFAYKEMHKRSKALRDAQKRLALKMPIIGDIMPLMA